MTPGVHIRPTERHAWHGPALVVTDSRGECGTAEHPGLSGFYFRETRYLSRLRLTVNGERPWLGAVGRGSQDELTFTWIHPELAGGTGGGSGSAGEELPRDAAGLPRRSIDLVARYRVGFHALDVGLVVSNRWADRAELELAWCVAADYADLLEAGDVGLGAAVHAVRPEDLTVRGDGAGGRRVAAQVAEVEQRVELGQRGRW